MTSPITELLAAQIAARHCPGALVHVEQAGRILARHAAGQIRPGDAAPMHDGVRFRVASLTKPVVTMAALMLVDEGRLALDSPLGDYLPALQDLRLEGGARPRAAPSVRDLMRHTSGLAYPNEIAKASLRAAWAQAGIAPALAGLSSADLLARLAGLPLVAEPGTAFRYGYSTDVLGCIVEQIESAPLGQVLQRRIFTPLGMRQTRFEIADDEDHKLALAHTEDAAWHQAIAPIGRRQAGQPWIDSGGGGLISTLDDYAAFARVLAAGGRHAGGRLLSEKLFAEMSRNQLPDGVDGPASYCGPGFGFGLGLAVRQDWGPSAMPCSAGEMVWSGLSGTALFVQPREQWFAILFSANLASRMMTRMAFRRAASQL
jgi:CubicO group peptidase (beta-lactamase class C family)